MDETTYEILEDGTLKITTPQAPKEEVVDLTAIADEKAALTQGLLDLDTYYATEQAWRKARITEIDALLAKAETMKAPV